MKNFEGGFESVVGIDPGATTVITSTDGEDKNSRNDSLSNKRVQHESKTHAIEQARIKLTRKMGVEEFQSRIPSFRCHSINQCLVYLR
jgi:hypothetical protein